jgi:hypothetical protein
MVKFEVKKDKKFFRGPRWDFFGKNKKKFEIKVCFRENCTYRLTENYDQINKLYGQSFKILPWYDKFDNKMRPGHHKDSVRFGWRCVDGETIELLAYVYINGCRNHKKMLTVKPETWTHLEFWESKEKYTFIAMAEDGEGSMVSFDKVTTKKGILGLFIHRLYPYFGGRISAPHGMRIDIKREK